MVIFGILQEEDANAAGHSTLLCFLMDFAKIVA